MLQMLALIAMERPKKLDGEHIRDAKAKVLKKIIYKDALLGQYKGYRNTTGVSKSSKTETFATLALNIDNNRWKGVPFFLKTGKSMEKKGTSIHIQFKENNNSLSIQIQPREGFSLEVNTKVPGTAYDVVPAKMDFCHACLFGPNTPQAYEVLLADVLLGDQSVFLRFDEIEYSWKLIDKILRKKHTVHSYEKNSNGPKKLEEFSKKFNLVWKG